MKDSARSRTVPEEAAVASPSDAEWLDSLESAYAVESWLGNLATGRFELGPLARAAHGIESDQPCGLSPILRAYEPASCARIAEIFCDTAQNGGRFSYIARTKFRDSSCLILATGETSVSANGRSGQIRGVFLLPRPALSPAGTM